MLFDGIELTGTSVVANLTVESGSDFPADNLNVGELFYKIDHGLHVYTGTQWVPVGGSGGSGGANSDGIGVSLVQVGDGSGGFLGVPAPAGADLVLTSNTIGLPTWEPAQVSGNGASLTNLNGSNIATGTVAVARLGSGTPTSSTYLRGDGAWTTHYDAKYDLALSITGKPAASAYVLTFIVVNAFSLPAGSSGGDSYFINASTVRAGGALRTSNNSAPGGVVKAGSGGNGGAGVSSRGGGAGGYSGTGGSGATAGSGGAGGSGATSYAGGGVGLLGEGATGANGVTGSGAGKGGSGGSDGSSSAGGSGGAYGGGGGANGSGGGGAVRIIWGTGKSFPNAAS